MKPQIARRDSTSSALNSVAVTKSDTVEIADVVPRGIWVGGAGTIVGQLYGDTADVTFAGIAAGTFLPFAFRLIKTGSTATNIVAVF